jgi:hypothetical protein
MKKIQVALLVILISSGIGFGVNQVSSQTVQTSTITAPSAPQIQYLQVNALDIVANPYKYLNRNVKINAKFDKFSTLGLDYPPAMRSSEKYISFLIQRPDITNHNIPLSEMKIFLKKEVAEKNIDLDAGDEVEFSGKIFSTALGDAWMDVDNFKVTKKN